jgi:hypothetical protein
MPGLDVGAAPGHIVLSQDEARLVHLVAEGYDLGGIASHLDADEGVARARLAALIDRLTAETGYRPAG